MSVVDVVGVAIGAMLIPWMSWLSITLYGISQHVTGIHERTVSNTRRIEDLEQLLPRHVPEV